MLRWDEVVLWARDQQVDPTEEGGAMCTPATTVAAPTAPAAAPAVQTVPPASAVRPAAGANGGGDRPVRKCAYCAPLGIGMDTHDHKWCYVDPKSQAYKPDVRARRIQQAKKRGVQLPAYLQDENPGTLGMVGADDSMADTLAGALRLVGSFGEEWV